jgi:hypothetical protein
MTIKGQYFVVGYQGKGKDKEPSIRQESKCFRVKRDAREYAALLMETPEASKSKTDPGWVVIKLETILDQ